MEEWKEYRLDTICNLSAGGDAPHNAVKVQTAEMNIPIYSNGESERGLYGYTNSYKVEAPAVTISARGNIGYVCYRKENFVPIVRLITAKANEQILSNEFLYYCLCNTRIWGDGSVQKQLTVPMISEYLVRIPPLSIQSKIVAILKSLDDKIEVNKRINDNLEQQAQSLFKSRFVDFDPFKDGEFVESELGMIPNGWRVYRLSDFLPVITGKKDANVAKGGPYPFFSCSQDFGWTDNYSFEGCAILVAGNGDFNVKMYSGKFDAYQRTYVLIPYNPRFAAWLYYAVKYHLNHITCAARGSVIKFITKGNLADFMFPAPSNLKEVKIIEAFDCIRINIASIEKESLRLAKLRDTLLPRLMSGELKVNELIV